MKFKIRGKVWKYKRPYKLPPSVNEKGEKVERLGDCDAPHVPNKEIRVLKKLKGEKELEIILHEISHCAFWDLDEEAIEEFAHDTARILTKLGYRKIEE